MKLVPPTFPLPGGPILQSGPYRRKHKISIEAVLHSLTSFEKLFMVQPLGAYENHSYCQHVPVFKKSFPTLGYAA
jgi:hypothetical protein